MTYYTSIYDTSPGLEAKAGAEHAVSTGARVSCEKALSICVYAHIDIYIYIYTYMYIYIYICREREIYI